MSLKNKFPCKIPEETRCLVEPLLEEDSVYRLIGHHAKEMLSDGDFIAMYEEDGRPAINPIVMSLVTV
jgi:hypothetical protein